METPRFRYYLKLLNGKLLYAEGTSIAEACENAGVPIALVKRSMPVRRVLTEAERTERLETFRKLRERYVKTKLAE